MVLTSDPDQGRRRVILQQLAHDHRQQPDRGRHAFRGYDRHLRVESDCPACLTRAGMAEQIRPGERVLFTLLVLQVDRPTDHQLAATWSRLVAAHQGDTDGQAYLR